MASAQAWRIKKQWASKFEEFLRTTSAGHLAVSLIRGDCVYSMYSKGQLQLLMGVTKQLVNTSGSKWGVLLVLATFQ